MISWEYVAGLFDGEGWISIERHNHCSVTQRVGISQNNKPLLQLVQEFIGVGDIRDGSGNSKGNFRLQVLKRADIVRFLEKVSPHLILRKAEAEIMLQFCKINQGQGSRPTPEEKQKQEALIVELDEAFSRRKVGA